jgi:hypothetical protein
MNKTNRTRLLGEVDDDNARLKRGVMVAKARRLPQDHTTLVLSGALLPWSSVPSSLRCDVREWRPSGTGVSTVKLLAWMRRQPALSAVISKAGEKKKHYTTHSFRRNYVHRVIDHFTGEDDIVIWKSVMEKTLHFSEKMVKSSYMKHASDYRDEMDMEDEE